MVLIIENGGGFVKKRKLIILWIIIAFLNLIAWLLPAFCDFYTNKITPIWVNIYGRIMGIFPFSVGEWLVVISIVYVLATVIITITWLFLRKKPRYTKFVKKYTNIFVTLFTIVCLIMTLNCSIYYHCTPISVNGNTNKEYSIEELEKLRNYIVEQCNYYSELVERDEDGNVIYDGNILQESKQALRNLSYDYPKLKGYYPDIKPLAFSNLFSQAYIAGYYFPFSMEANYNKNMYICNYPETYCHELAHLHGFIYEDEANFLAFRACIESEAVFFKYSGYLSVLNYIENTYWSRVNWDEALAKNPPLVNETVKKDNVFLTEEAWTRVEEHAVISTNTVSNVSDNLMNGSLIVNGVKDGMESYRRVVSLLLQYYDGKL